MYASIFFTYLCAHNDDNEFVLTYLVSFALLEIRKFLVVQMHVCTYNSLSMCWKSRRGNASVNLHY